MGKFKCPKCEYESDKWSVKRHIERKHKELSVGRAPTTVSIPPMYGDDVQAAATHQHTSNPHVHPYLNHTNQSIPSNWFIAQHPHEYEYAIFILIFLFHLSESEYNMGMELEVNFIDHHKRVYQDISIEHQLLFLFHQSDLNMGLA